MPEGPTIVILKGEVQQFMRRKVLSVGAGYKHGINSKLNLKSR